LAALQIMKGLPQSKNQAARLINVINNIEAGCPLSAALDGLLPPLVLSSIKSAERAGNLETTLGQLALFYRGRAELEEKLKGALIYPCFVAGMSLAVMMGIFLFILPGFSGLFADLGTELPWFTKALIGIGELWYIFPAALLLGAVIIRRRFSALPGIGRLYRQEQIIQGLGSLGALLQGGVPLVEALTAVARATKNSQFQGLIERTLNEVQNGAPVSRALAAGRYFPEAAIQMIRVGESSGRLAEMLLSAADWQAREREEYLKRLAALAEPALTLVVGALVAFVVLAIFLPLTNMVSTLQ
jgi:type II secretory pathway component PulF